MQKEQAEYQTEMKRQEQQETLSLLDQLRKTRKARGGVGEPLEIPGHLRRAAALEGFVLPAADADTFEPSPLLVEAIAEFEDESS